MPTPIEGLINLISVFLDRFPPARESRDNSRELRCWSIRGIGYKTRDPRLRGNDG